MLADLPPSSWATRLTVSAAVFATMIPARVEPVKDIMATSGCPARYCPTVGPSPFTRLNTPLGTRTASMISANTMPLIGAISLGFSTMVHPAAIAGATLQTIWFRGQFQGVMSPATPMGSRTMRVVPRWNENSSPSSALIVASMCTWPAQACASRANLVGAPISSVTASAISS